MNVVQSNPKKDDDIESKKKQQNETIQTNSNKRANEAQSSSRMNLEGLCGRSRAPEMPPIDLQVVPK